jgi:hypothetical protein
MRDRSVSARAAEFLPSVQWERTSTSTIAAKLRQDCRSHFFIFVDLKLRQQAY